MSKQSTKKLSLRKKTISDLSNDQLKKVLAGGKPTTPTSALHLTVCGNTCGAWCGGGGL